MRKLLGISLIAVVAFVTGRLSHQLPVNAQEGGDDPACQQDRTLHSIDSNRDGGVDLSDAVHLLTWLFQGGPEPQVCLAQTTLEARVEALEAVLTEEKREILSHISMVELASVATCPSRGVSTSLMVATVASSAATRPSRDVCARHTCGCGPP